VQLGAAERGVDHVGRPVQSLRRSEDLAAEAVRDHHVIADGHAEHPVHPSPYVMTWHSPGSSPAANRSSTSGSSSKPDSPVISAATTGWGSSSSASARRAAWVRLDRRAGETAPTWLPRMVSRPEWNDPPSDRFTGRSPYQLSSITVPSGASRSSDRCSPAGA